MLIAEIGRGGHWTAPGTEPKTGADKGWSSVVVTLANLKLAKYLPALGYPPSTHQLEVTAHLA